MIMQRRAKEKLGSKLRNLLWPKMGWKRALAYYKHRILRIPHSTRDIALGLSLGCVVSWTPTFGLHILQCFIFCKIFRANFLASIIGTLFGNPWTFPLLMWISYMVGNFVMDATNLHEVLAYLAGESELFSEENYGMKHFMPTLIGGYIVAVVTLPFFYYGFYYLITVGRASRRVVGKKVHDIIEHHQEKKKEEEDNKS